MKTHFIEKLADLMTNPKSAHRTLPAQGEYHLCGSTEGIGSFSILVKFDGDDIQCSGFAGRQYLTTHKNNNNYEFKLTRMKGGVVRGEDGRDKGIMLVPVFDKDAMYRWFENWFREVSLDTYAGV